MKVRLKSLWELVFLVILIILAGQGLWIYSMIEAYKKEFNNLMNTSLENVIFRDINSRSEHLGGTIAFSRHHALDTGRYIRKQVVAADTSFWVDVDRYDKYSDLKITQLMIQDILPLNVNKLDTLFCKELMHSEFTILDTYVESVDLKTGRILNTDKTGNAGNDYLSTNLIPININNSQGVRGYAKIEGNTILEKMLFQLVLSGVLILIVSFYFFYLIYVIYEQKKADEMQQRSVNAMTHEFKRPISAAVAQAALIPFFLDGKNFGKVKAYAGNILLELQKLTAYTERIQQISRGEKGTILLNKSAVDIKSFFEAFGKKYAGKEDPDVDLQLIRDTRREQMKVDPLHFSNVMDNLVENAIKYRKENQQAHIVIRISDRKDFLLISVKDSGIGMSLLDKIHIFNRYYRSKVKAVQRTPGFGLGLTYVQSIVEAHGGTIGVESKLGEGSDFIVEIPVD